jgi:hypothetical protein
MDAVSRENAEKRETTQDPVTKKYAQTLGPTSGAPSVL